MTLKNLLVKGAALGLLSLAVVGCIPNPKIEAPNNGTTPLVPRPALEFVSTDFTAADTASAYAIVGDSITLNLRATAGEGITAIRATRINSLTYTPLLLKSDTFVDGRTSHNYTYGYRVPNTTATWIRLSFHLRDSKGNESFRHYRLNLLSPTRGTAIREVVLYRQGFDASIAQAGTIYAQFLSTRNQQVSARYRSDLGIDLCYAVDPSDNKPYLFSPDLPAATINSRFPLFPTLQIANPFAGGIRPTTMTPANATADSLRVRNGLQIGNQIQEIAAGRNYLVRCFPLNPITPVYGAVVNVTSISDSLVFGSGPGRTVFRGRGIQMKANVTILRQP